MEMQLHTGDYLRLRRLPTVRYLKGSKASHYIFMWIVGVLKVKICPLQ
jgi:hypothetical protein